MSRVAGLPSQLSRAELFGSKLRAIETPGDGNCLLHSLSIGASGATDHSEVMSWLLWPPAAEKGVPRYMWIDRLGWFSVFYQKLQEHGERFAVEKLERRGIRLVCHGDGTFARRRKSRGENIRDTDQR